MFMKLLLTQAKKIENTLFIYQAQRAAVTIDIIYKINCISTHQLSKFSRLEIEALTFHRAHSYTDSNSIKVRRATRRHS